MSVFTVINESNKDRYTVDSYNLKVLSCDLPDLKEVVSGVVHTGFKDFDDIQKQETENQEQSDKKLENSETEDTLVGESLEPVLNESHDALIESLLKKADDFSSKYLKAQMELETFKEESALKEETIRKEALKEGQDAAKEAASNEVAQRESEVITQLQNSIETLNTESKQFSISLDSVKNELVLAALAIAKEVIVKELNENATQMALDLASSLIKEIDSKSDITLKVHPNQLETFNTAMATNKRIEVLGDLAVNEGGVIILSQMGTIEADIMQRFEHIKRNTLTQ